LPHRFPAAGAVALAAAFIAPAVARGAPPACNNSPQIADASGDGHHSGTDVLAAWWSESSGHLQAVIQVRAGLFVAEHDDAQINGSGFALVFSQGGATRYVRATAPAQAHAGDPVAFDYGTYASPGGFASTGATNGVAERSPGAGTVTIDVPGVAAGEVLANPFVVTYDGINNGMPDWVDHAPGGVDPAEASFGADYIAGSCGAGAAPPVSGVTSVELDAPAKVKGRRTVTVRGRVLPARGGVAVTLTRTRAKTLTLTTAADGTFASRVAVGETSRLRATAGGIASRELTLTMYSKVRIKIKRRKDGSALVTGTVDPRLPGRVLWLRTSAVTPSARTSARNGKFRLRLRHPRHGRYQAVFIPSGKRAERATSNTGVIR
jgi:hypothetical protein